MKKIKLTIPMPTQKGKQERGGGGWGWGIQDERHYIGSKVKFSNQYNTFRG